MLAQAGGVLAETEGVKALGHGRVEDLAYRPRGVVAVVPAMSAVKRHFPLGSWGRVHAKVLSVAVENKTPRDLIKTPADMAIRTRFTAFRAVWPISESAAWCLRHGVCGMVERSQAEVYTLSLNPS